MAETVNVGILGRGTVGSAFRELLEERAAMVEEVSGRRPEVAGVLSSKDGDFEQILAASDIVVELIGGIDPALDYVTRALREGKHVVTANKQLIAQHGDQLVAAAREGGAQLRFEAAVAGAIPVIRVIQESSVRSRSRRCSGSSTARPTTSSPRWREVASHMGTR